MSTKTAHEELRAVADSVRMSMGSGPADAITRAIAEYEAVKERASDAEHESEMWEQHMQEFTDNESDEAPWITIQNEFKELQSKLTAYEKQWTEMHETICKFQEENSALSKTVTALALAIDPSSTHGPETEKIAGYAETTRRLALELATASFSNPHYTTNKAREIRKHLDFEHPVNGGIQDDELSGTDSGKLDASERRVADLCNKLSNS